MKKVLCIGSVTVDVMVLPCDSLPQPGELRSVESISTHIGGCAANAAGDLAKLGVPVTLSCKVGNDSFGDFVISASKELGVDVSGIVRTDKVGTTVSVVCIRSGGERSFLYNPGSAATFVKEDINEKIIEENDIIFVAGAMLLTDFDGEDCASVMKKARQLGKYTIMDTAWDFQDIWLPKVAPVIPYLDLFMPSVEEASKITGISVDQPELIADKLFELGAKNVIIKIGKRGALICEAGKPKVILPTYGSVSVVDTTGAGDSFCAGFITGLAQDWNYIESGKLGNAVGTHCIMAVGATTGIKPLKEILHFMEEHKAEVNG